MKNNFLFIVILGGICVSRSYSTTNDNMSNIATYDEVLDLPNHPEKVLIDVREPSELKEFGQIPTSINIPRKFFFFIFGFSLIFLEIREIGWEGL